jgi:tetratricopeptide (TPR) repeat protein
MEYVAGDTLREWLRGARPPLAAIVDRCVQAGRGLAAAHRAGLVHRDFKPDNAVVGADGRVRVLDFGLARAEGDTDPTAASPQQLAAAMVSSGLSTPITRAGSVLGTPAYMPPEQLLGGRADARSDQFSFCVAMWEALYGARPFAGETFRQLAAAIDRGPPPDPPGKLPRHLRAALARGLQADPAARFPDMDALLAALLADPRARRRRWFAAAAGALALAGMAGAAWLSDQQTVSRCEARAALVDAVWSDEIRAEAEAAILGTRMPFSAATWARVATDLDAWADEFRADERAACLDARAGDPLAAARQSCLFDQVDALRGWTEALRVADASVVPRAAFVAAELPRLHVCDDPATWSRGRPRGDLDERLRGQAVRRSLARARVQIELGKHADGGKLAEAALATAAGLGDTALRAEAELTLGRASRRAGKLPAAERWISQSYFHAGAIGADALTAEAAAELIHVVGYALARHDEGLSWARHARLFAARLGGAEGRFLESTIDNNVGAVLAARGEPEEAERLFHKVLAVRQAALGAGHLSLAMAHNNIGAVARARGDFAGAEQAFRSATEMRELLLGPDHPELVGSLNNLGVLLHDMGRHEEALTLLRRAVALREQTLGPQHVDVAICLNNIGNTLAALGAFAESEAVLRRAASLWERGLGAEHPNVAFASANLSRTLAEQGEFAGARAAAERALAIYRVARGADPKNMALTRERLAAALLGEGRVADARAELTTAAKLRERTRARDDADFAGSLRILGALLIERGLAADATPRLRHAAALFARLRGPDHADVAHTEVLLAAALRAAGDPAASDLMHGACDRSEQTWPSEHPSLAHARLVCGEDALASGDLVRATRLLRAALDGGALPLERRGRARFALARSLGAGVGEARALAEQARADLTAAPTLLAAVDAWLANSR